MATTEKAAVIVNPVSAGGRTRRTWPGIMRLLSEAGMTFDWFWTSRPGHATALAMDAIKSGYELVVSVGGDGTLNEVVNGFFDENGDPLNPEAELGIIPCGTGSDFIKTIGIPRRPAEAIRRLIDGTARRIDLGRVRFRDHEGKESARYFINVADLGFGGDVATRVNRSRKVLGGFLSFLYGALSAIICYRGKEVVICPDDQGLIHKKVISVMVANGQYLAAGMRIAPMARLDSGLLDIVIIEDLRLWEFLLNLFRTYSGTHISHPRVHNFTCRTLRVTSKDRILLQLDGEVPGVGDADFCVVPGAIRVRA